MESEDRHEQPAPENEDERHPHERAAEDLSGRAAESVGRRYDATKESVHEADLDERQTDEGDGD
jgi:hypothetical protein